MTPVGPGFRKAWTPLQAMLTFSWLAWQLGNVLIKKQDQLVVELQRNVTSSGVVPQISLIMGPCAGGRMPGRPAILLF